MKDCWVRVVVAGLVTVGLVRALPSYGLRPLPAVMQDLAAKRGFWDKRTSITTDPDQDLPQVWEDGGAMGKRGFGSMMPAYLLQLYRSDQPLLNPSDIFSSTRPTSERGKSGYSNRG